ncbi:MAG: hypothetical protein IT332_11075 [Ardenticatenales bacterium]|nr:hypothetical protein [Ardenticatenales bacterium]
MTAGDVTDRRAVQAVPVIVLGLGGVGRALVRQIVAARPAHARRFGLALHVVALADSGATAVASPLAGARHAVPLHDPLLLAFVDAKAAGRGLVDVADDRAAVIPSPLVGARHAVPSSGTHGDAPAWHHIPTPHAIVVDCTAADATTPHLRAALERGWDIVLANKLPLAGPLDDFAFLTGNGVDAGEGVVPRRRGRARWEATVGAGVPLIATLSRLVAADDAVARIEGTFSGTLNFVAAELRAGRPLSEIVREAMARGFTEPDPRTDLGGHDMARKALILARMLGWEILLDDVTVHGLYPPEWDDPSHPDHVADVDAFLERLPELDAPAAERVAAAKAADGVYRLVAMIADGRAAVTPTVVPADSPLGRLAGTDNLVAFHSRWYDTAPLVLQGRGAGVEATASGVLADVVDLAMRRGGTAAPVERA